MKKKVIDGVESVEKQESVSLEEQDKSNKTPEQPVEQKPDEPEIKEQKAPTQINPETEDVPGYVADYFKRHKEMKEAYIDKFGGVFQLGTPKVFMKDAVLYQNPFYKQ